MSALYQRELIESRAKRIEEIGDALLILGDSLEILPTLGPVDAVVTDPPYGAQTHAGARTGENGGEKLIDFPAITTEQSIEITRRLCLKAERWVIMSCEWRHAAHFEDAGLPLVRLGVWIKPNGAPQFTGDRPGTGWEAVAILHRAGRKRWNGGGHHAVWNFPKTEGEHPTQKPLPLVSEWVSLFSEPGETILDPFMGSGTTGVACANLGRKFIGIEREPKYFDIACRRIADAYKQPRLFEDPKPEPVQGDLL